MLIPNFLLPLLCYLFSTRVCALILCSTNTSSGTLTGECTANFGQFLGVRYAEAPTGDLRFAPAQDYTTSDEAELVHATALPVACPQLNEGTEGSVTSLTEDCLFLNVYTPPSAVQKAGTDCYPVIFYIYGGSFIVGSSGDPTFNGTHLAKTANAVVVTFNYRLGVFGFYDSTETGTNFAISDAQSALRWVQKNAYAFGGDPSRVTIVGESSGATLVRALIVSPQSADLFHNAILQSDPQTYGFTDSSVSSGGIAQYVQNATNCTTVSCLRSLPVEELLNAEMNIYSVLANISGINGVYPWGPNLDNKTLPVDFAVAAATGQGFVSSSLNILMGSLAYETGPTIAQLVGNSGIDYSTLQEVVASELTEQGAEVLESANVYDFNSSASPITNEYLLEQIGTDYEFLCPMQYNAASIVQSKLAKSVYFYHISAGIHYPDNDGFVFCNSSSSACHEDDLYALFGTSPSSLSSQQSAFATEVQQRWGAFAASGNPNVKGYSTWTAASSSANLNVLTFGTAQTESTSAMVHSGPCGFFGTSFPYVWQQTAA